jgi:hypothetical protein
MKFWDDIPFGSLFFEYFVCYSGTIRYTASPENLFNKVGLKTAINPKDKLILTGYSDERVVGVTNFELSDPPLEICVLERSIK